MARRRNNFSNRALCYAELATAYPSTGGDYHFLGRAYGAAPAFLFAWARMAVIQTGSLAMLGFLAGDYASGILSLGPYSSAIYAGLAIAALTAVNIAGIRQGSFTQNGLTAGILAGLLVVIMTGLFISGQSAGAAAKTTEPGIGKAMIFVLLTYGGWNEAAYLSAEVRGAERNMAKALVVSIAIITAIYVLFNVVLLKGLGFPAVSGSDTVAADLMRKGIGEAGTLAISIIVIFAVLSTMNGTIITGARTNYALGRDFGLFGFLGRWHARGGTPVNALLLQGAIALALVLVGTSARSGFESMVEYTAPVFWFFFFLVGISVIVLRSRDSASPRPFRVPLYPLTPLAFCTASLYMFQASLAYTGKGALLGLGVLIAGIPLYLLDGRKKFF